MMLGYTKASGIQALINFIVVPGAAPRSHVAPPEQVIDARRHGATGFGPDS